MFPVLWWDKFALLWGEAQFKKVMTYSDPMVTYNHPKMTYPKVT